MGVTKSCGWSLACYLECLLSPVCVCSVDNLKAFVQQYMDGDLEVYVKSDPIPEDNDGPVKVRI